MPGLNPAKQDLGDGQKRKRVCVQDASSGSTSTDAESQKCAVESGIYQTKQEFTAEQQSWSPGPDQKPPQIKEEDEEAEITEFIFTSEPLKNEDEEEKPQFSELHPFKIEEDRAFVGAEPDPGVQTLLVLNEELSVVEQSWSPKLDQEDQNRLQIKEEQEDSEITGFIFNPVPVKSENDEEKPQLSELHSQPEENRDSAGPESDEEENSPETDLSDGNWEESADAPSCSDSVGSNNAPVCEKGKRFHHCSECGKTFNQKSDLLRHNRVHTGEKPYCCSICKASFTWKHILVQHMRTHSGERPFTCSVCGQTFRKKETLVYHMRCHSDEKPFGCSVCGQTFSRKESVNRHMTCHTKDKPFSCSVCGQTFKRKESETRHMRSHTEEKPFSCSICHRAFTSKVTFTKHAKIHSENRPFKCSVCNAAFKKKKTLSEHARSHTGEKHCCCQICGQSLSSKSYLSIHMRSHTGEKPYSCSVCKATFKWKKTLQRHSKVHPGQLWSPCLQQPGSATISDGSSNTDVSTS